MYCQQKICFMISFCKYIAEILLFRKGIKPKKYNVFRRIIFITTSENIYSQIYFGEIQNAFNLFLKMMFIALVALELSHSKEIKDLHFEDALLRGMRNFSEDETNLKKKKGNQLIFSQSSSCMRGHLKPVGDNKDWTLVTTSS